jgi:hypothetical protein
MFRNTHINISNIESEVKDRNVKQSRYRTGVALRVPGS